MEAKAMSIKKVLNIKVSKGKYTIFLLGLANIAAEVIFVL